MFVRRPFRLLFDGPEETGSSKAEAEKKPTSEMTPEERIEFEENAKRRAQDKLKAFNGVTPEDVEALRRQIAGFESEKLTEQERAVNDARDQTRSEVTAQAAAETVDAVLKVALRGRTADAGALLDLDKKIFINDGSADVDAISAWVEENSTLAGGEKRPPVNIGQGKFEQMTVSDRATGEAEAQKRFGKNN